MRSAAPINSPLEDDVFVRKEVVIGLFHPPISEATFHRKVKEGFIVKARGSQGFYRLNATRRKLGLPTLDVQAYKKGWDSMNPIAREALTVYFAVLEVEPELEGKGRKPLKSPVYFTKGGLEAVGNVVVTIKLELNGIDARDQDPYLRGMIDGMALLLQNKEVQRAMIKRGIQPLSASFPRA